MRALVVDDSSTMRFVIGRELRALGIEAIFAPDGRRALDMLLADSACVHVILTDWNMPVMNGLELVRAVRADPRTRHLPIIMVTTATEENDVSAVLAAGADEYLMKPFDRAAIREKLELLDLLPHGGPAHG